MDDLESGSNSLFVVGEDPVLMQVLWQNGVHILGQVTGIDMFAPIAGRCRARYVLLALNAEYGDPVEVIAQARILAPGSRIVVLLAGHTQADPIAAGASLVFTPPFDYEAIAASLYREEPGSGPVLSVGDVIREKAWARHDTNVGRKGVEWHDETRDPEVVVFFGPKGGVGRTFLAANVAAAVAGRTDSRVVLVDLDISGGDVGVYLDLKGPTLIDLLPHIRSRSREALDRCLLRHVQSGLSVILGPERPELDHLVTDSHLGSLLDWLRSQFSIVFLDFPGRAMDERLQRCLELASHLIVVTGADAASIRQTRLALDLLRRRSPVCTRKLLLVINRSGPEMVSAGEIGRVLGLKPVSVVPEDRTHVERSILAGRPIVMTNPEQRVAQGILRIADAIHPGDGGRKAGRSGLGEMGRRVRDLVSRCGEMAAGIGGNGKEGGEKCR